MLNKSKGNMYPWVTHTWNVIKGKCPHNCSYCYMKRYPQSELRFDKKEFKTDLGSGNFIFVGSSCDMWVTDSSWVEQILDYCWKFNNRYLFQTKAPNNFLPHDFWMPFTGNPRPVILGTTIETNRWYDSVMGKAISPVLRVEYMNQLVLPKLVSIEPIMDFDLDVLVGWIQKIKPDFVSVGADSGNNGLPEPPPEKVLSLIDELKVITQVKIKDNLQRLVPEGLPI